VVAWNINIEIALFKFVCVRASTTLNMLPLRETNV